jgi:hypothetical protein
MARVLSLYPATSPMEIEGRFCAFVDAVAKKRLSAAKPNAPGRIVPKG